MNILVILVTGLIGVNGFKLKSATVDDNEDEMYVIGGRDAKPGDAPWQVLVEEVGRGSCGGSLLNARHVLTAAHCCRGTDPIVVMFGGLNVTALQNRINVSKAIINPYYNDETGDNDYCVLKLAKDVVESDHVKFIKIAERSPASGTPCKLTGWGISRRPTPTDQLQIAELNILSSVDCERRWMKAPPGSWNITKNMICSESKTAGGCHGDSGGPLVVNNELVGVVSWGDPECTNSTVWPTVYADPTESKARKWIIKNIK